MRRGSSCEHPASFLLRLSDRVFDLVHCATAHVLLGRMALQELPFKRHSCERNSLRRNGMLRARGACAETIGEKGGLPIAPRAPCACPSPTCHPGSGQRSVRGERQVRRRPVPELDSGRVSTQRSRRGRAACLQPSDGEKNAKNDGFRPRRAAGDEHVHGQDLSHAASAGVAAPDDPT